MLIAPITVRLIAYGQKANIAAIRRRAESLLEEEHGSVAAQDFVAMGARDVHAEIAALRWDSEVALKPPSRSRVGIAIALREIHERLANEWLQELPIAATCVAFATWTSMREAASWQLLLAQGGRWAESRPAPAQA
jgi:hypothetical protein